MSEERRYRSRKAIESPIIGFIYSEKNKKLFEKPSDCPLNSSFLTETRTKNKSDRKKIGFYLFVDIINISPDGVLLVSSVKFRLGARFHLYIKNQREVFWEHFFGNVRWTEPDNEKSGYYLVGIRCEKAQIGKLELDTSDLLLSITSPLSDYSCIWNNSLLKCIPREAICLLLNSLNLNVIKAGELLISQGETGNTCYLIGRGTCVVSVEKEGKSHFVSRLHSGDIVGEMAMVTGEPRNASVLAETDMTLWSFPRHRFDHISGEYPELGHFLTEIITNRFDSSTLIADRTIGKYLITEVIGRGGYSIVYKGLHSNLNMNVAIKMLRHNLAMDPVFLNSFRNEARIIGGFNHENIVRIYDIEEIYRTIFIMMEYLEGESLDDMLNRLGPLPPDKLIDYLIQSLSGLGYAHQKGIIHRDLNGGNLFIQTGGCLKILDFGLACSVESEDRLPGGTLSYMAPELMKGEKGDQRSDIYSLGIIAYEMATGKRPYPDKHATTLMLMILGQDIPDPAEKIPDLPRPLRRFILKACARDPKQRYQSTGQAILELSPLVEIYGLDKKSSPIERRRMAKFCMFYRDEQKHALNSLMDEFSLKAKEIGVDLIAADL